ncbi:MAG: transketolase family protein [Candidatus Cloacimonetes bacterium]|nr:transketolase family protein [Candidatus Cloacimonadota bacterium]MBS3766502.1 transketolase family protein [Candidatus Cloacimonadota bacterium]
MKKDIVPIRDGYGKALLELGEINDKVIVMDADLSTSTRTNWFAEKYPQRFVDVGIAEQNMVNVAAGLSLEDKIPFVTTYGVFVCGRAFDQIRNTVCYSDLNVKIVGSHGGISVGPDGGSHQAIEDIGLMRILPNMTVVVPCDHVQAYKATLKLAELKGPAYLRLAREPTATITSEADKFSLGKADILQKGNDCAIFFTGTIGAEVIKASEMLKNEGINPTIINMHTIKPLDKEIILEYAKKFKKLVVVEEHLRTGGLGSAISSVLTEKYPIRIKHIAIEDRFGESGQPEVLLDAFGLSARKIKKQILDFIQ